MTGVHFDLHGVTLSLATEDGDLASFAKEQFEAEPGVDPRAEIAIQASFRWGAEAEGAGPLSDLRRSAAREKLGRGLDLVRAEGRTSAIWSRVPDFPELKMAFGLDSKRPSRLEILADCSYAPKGVGRKLEYLRPGRSEKKRGRLFFKLMYFLVYYPLAWRLQRTRGWGLLHASAVVSPSGKTVLLSGLGGVGKSTLGLSLLSRPGARLVSDNLLFHDEERVYACPEPVRLDQAAVDGIASEGLPPERTKLPLSAHPKPTYRVGPSRRADAAVPSALYFLRFAPEAGLTPIEPSRAAEMLAAGGDLAREIKDYRPCAALLNTLTAEHGSPERAARADLARLLRSTSCAIFRIGPGEEVGRTAVRLTQSLGWAR